MINAQGERALAHVESILALEPIPNADKIEVCTVLGWKVVVRKDEFRVGDKVVYIEIDSKVPEREEFEFLRDRKFKVKTIRLRGQYSQGLVMPLSILGRDAEVGEDVTKELGIKYSVAEDNARKSNSVNKTAKYESMAARHKNLFKKKPFKWLMRRKWGRKLLFIFFGKKKDSPKGWPVGKFPGVSKTDQERCESMPWVLNDKTPYIVTQKCDGSSGTYILERKKHNKFEFYVCSRNVRMVDEKQECYCGSNNYYWEVAKKYDIENKMKEWLINHPKATFICWQGEICAPGIQKNPHHLTETHFYCFHWTDSINGRRNIVDAAFDWASFGMEVVPITSKNYILPDDFEAFKLSADGYYQASCCEGNDDCLREGFVYYKTTDPSFSFKNVSRKYLMAKGE